jgi:F0F1-type ATP synthase membrane subunit b/b'
MDLINGRKTIVFKSLQEAENKFNEAEKNLSFSKQNLAAAEARAEEIRNQALVLSMQTSKQLLDAIEEDIKRLKLVNLSVIRFEEEKSIADVVMHFLFS